jgi:hypothetical protein
MDYQFDWKWPKTTRLVGEDDFDSKSAKKFLGSGRSFRGRSSFSQLKKINIWPMKKIHRSSRRGDGAASAQHTKFERRSSTAWPGHGHDIRFPADEGRPGADDPCVCLLIGVEANVLRAINSLGGKTVASGRSCARAPRSASYDFLTPLIPLCALSLRPRRFDMIMPATNKTTEIGMAPTGGY